MLVLLTTGGTGNNKEVVYSWSGKGHKPQEYSTAHFQIAAYDFFKPDKVLFVATQDAIEHDNCKKIQEFLGDRMEIVPIPTGSSHEEMWEIFDTVSNAVPEGARIILDITHGFRSQPLLLFGVVTYLEKVKGTSLELIVYGAYEAREEKDNGVIKVPVFDLTVLADLQMWLQAVDTFAVRSDAGRLAELLNKAQNREWTRAGSSQDSLPRKLKTIAKGLEEFSDSVRLLRPFEAIKAASVVACGSKDVKEESSKWAKPFSYVLDSLAKEVNELAMENPDKPGFESLERQLTLIEHYVQKDLLVQAVLLAREWVVSWATWRTDKVDWLDLDTRLSVSRALNAAAKNLSDGNVDVPLWLTSISDFREAAKLWNWLHKFRNDVAHCAMDSDAASSKSVKDRAKELPGKLGGLLVKN